MGLVSVTWVRSNFNKNKGSQSSKGQRAKLNGKTAKVKTAKRESKSKDE
jgi:hypothetical protein